MSTFKKITFIFISLIFLINLSFAQNITLQYKCGNSTVNSNQISVHLNLKNNDSQNLDLNNIEIRYYYTLENSVGQLLFIDYAVIGNSNVILEIVPLSGNDCYLKISFAENVNSLSPGGETGVIQIRMNNSDWSNYEQDNDYSFDGSFLDFADCDKITVYNNTSKIWGIPPGEGTENILPTVEITSPQNNSQFIENTQITVNANANDVDGSITKVEFYLNNTKIAEDTTSAYSTVINGLSSGSYNITVKAYDNNNASATSGNIIITVNPLQNDDYVNIPAKIEAEDYIDGGEGTGYHDTTAGNTGGAYKSDDVDIEICDEGTYNVGWLDNGEWLKYKINVPETGDFDFQIRVARYPTGNGQLHLQIDDQDITGIMDVPCTDGWQNYITIEKKNIQLTSGQHELKLYFNSNSFNVNWINIIYSTVSSDDPIPVTIKISNNTANSNTITLSPAPTHMGNSIITGTDGYQETVYYTDPTTVTISGGSEFTSWSGNLSGNTNPSNLTITVNQTYTVTGTFGTINAVNNDDWLSTNGNKIIDASGREVRLIGINYFGFETELHGFEGLAYSSLDDSLDFIADHGFNIIRIPISVQLVTEWRNGNYPTACYAYEETGIELDYNLNPGFEGITSLEMLDYTVNYCKQKGLKIMLDMHRVIHFKKKNIWFYSGESAPSWVPPGQDEWTFKNKYKQYFNYTLEDFYQAWEYLVNRYKDDDTIVAVDLFNEPHGLYDNCDSDGDGETDGLAAKWDGSTDPNNLRYVSEQAAQRIHAINPNLLIMVEGIQVHNGTSTWWGGNLKGVNDQRVNLGINNKLVYEPHDYGPRVAIQPWFSTYFNKDTLFNDVWNNFWFYIHSQQIAPIVVGEWGSRYEDQNDIDWFNYFITFISENDLNYFYWCFNPSSGDTGGIVKYDEFYNEKRLVIHDKYNRIKDTMWFDPDGNAVGLDHIVPLGANGISVTDYYE